MITTTAPCLNQGDLASDIPFRCFHHNLCHGIPLPQVIVRKHKVPHNVIIALWFTGPSKIWLETLIFHASDTTICCARRGPHEIGLSAYIKCDRAALAHPDCKRRRRLGGLGHAAQSATCHGEFSTSRPKFDARLGAGKSIFPAEWPSRVRTVAQCAQCGLRQRMAEININNFTKQ